MSTERDVWTALGGSPLRFLTSAWPWRSWAYVASGAVSGLVTFAVLVSVVLFGVLTAVLVVGVLVLIRLPLLGVAVSEVERRRLGLLRQPLARAEAGWRAVGYAVLLATVLWLVDAMVAFIAVLLPGVLLLTPVLWRLDDMDVLGWQVNSAPEAWLLALIGAPVAFGFAAYVVTLLAAAQAALARTLLGAGEAELALRVDGLRRSRIDLVDAFESEAQRIERDLHDGVQQRLVALTMTLGRAELALAGHPGLHLVEEAHRHADQALEELRDTVRGIHPRVLVDHGLEGAIRELADRSALPVAVELALDRRLPAAVEAAAYFVVSEALTNVGRHAEARSASVVGWCEGDRLVLTVTDDGLGGAAPQPGSGLAGLAARLEARGGRLQVVSPTGGPTEIRMECAWVPEP